MASLKVAAVEAVSVGVCYCGCGAPVPEGKFWKSGHDHAAICEVIRAYGGTASLLASLGLAPTRRRGKRGGK